MKLISTTYLTVALLLSGCSTLDLGGSFSKPSTATAPATAPSSSTQASIATDTPAVQHTPVFPDGPLSSITSTDLSGDDIANLEAPQDLWDRIRKGFAMPDLQHDLVQDREQWYASRPDYIQRMTERSSRYLFHIVEELERRNMPTELALLPYIESAFNPQAVSSAKAAGMWQFMPATGTYFSLKQNAFRDDRRDVLASTKAALDYLQKLHNMFGDWHLALAAYNWGEGSVGRAIAKNQKAGLPTGYTDLTMPAETRLYVPKLQAVKNIVANPALFKTELPLIENHPYFQKVEIRNDIDVALVAKLAGIKEADFKALNPSFNKPVILAAGTPEILLPWDNAKVFRANLEAYTKGQHASWTVWSVPKTMSPAEAARRVDMSEADLRRVNDIPPRMLIKAGSALMVARSASMHSNVSSQLADNAHVAFTPELVTKRRTVIARKGDNVSSIAKRYKVSAADVADWNNIKTTSSLKKGQKLVLNMVVPANTRSSRSIQAKRSSSRSSGRASSRTVATASSRSSAKSTNNRSSRSASNTNNRKSSSSSKVRR